MRGPPLSPGPVEAGARAIAARHLDAAQQALVRLANGAEDPEALHDFRVALRRLRSCMRAYRAHLDAQATPVALERTRDLASRTGAARDAEVQVAWLERQREVRPARRAAVELMTRDLAALVERARRATHAGLERDFAALVGELAPALASYSARISLQGPPEGRSFGAVSAELVREAAQHLLLALAHVRTERDEEPAHRARIEAKRLRYLLEPLAAEVRVVGHAIRRMRGLQDLLGELNDLRVLRVTLARALETAVLAHAQRRLVEIETGAPDAAHAAADRDAEAGLLSLARTARARRGTLFARLAAQWLADASPQRLALAAEIDAVTARLAKGTPAR